MRKKKIVSLLLALVMTVTMLAGCGCRYQTAFRADRICNDT